MEIHFLLGVLLSVMVFLLGYAVVGTFKNSRNIEDNHHWLETMDRDVHQRIDNLYKELDSEIKTIDNRIDMEFRELQSNIDENERDIISLLDRRLDKLENRLKSNLSESDINQLGYELSNLKTKVDEFIRTYQNQ